MNKTREFNNILDECLGRLLYENETVEQCLQRYPKQADELKPLLETALAARPMTKIAPRPGFREQASLRFLAELRQIAERKSRPAFGWGWQPRWVTVVSIVLAVFLAGSGTVAAASGSMPNSPLYPVKQATEQVQLALTFSDLSKAELLARLADKRVTEIAYLADKGKPEKIGRTTEKLNTHLIRISMIISPPGLVARLAEPAAQLAAVPEAAPAAPAEPPGLMQAAIPEETPAAERAAPAAKEKGASEEALELKAATVEDKKEVEEEDSKTDRKAKLKDTVESQAKQNIERLKALLKTAPESAKPALKQAIELAEAEYEKTIEALK